MAHTTAVVADDLDGGSILSIEEVDEVIAMNGACGTNSTAFGGGQKSPVGGGGGAMASGDVIAGLSEKSESTCGRARARNVCVGRAGLSEKQSVRGIRNGEPSL